MISATGRLFAIKYHGGQKGFLSWHGPLQGHSTSPCVLLPEQQRNKDTVRCSVLGEEVSRHRQEQLTQIVSKEIFTIKNFGGPGLGLPLTHPVRSRDLLAGRRERPENGLLISGVFLQLSFNGSLRTLCLPQPRMLIPTHKYHKFSLPQAPCVCYNISA